MLGTKTLMSQFARPHGILGRLVAPTIPMAHRQFYPKVARALEPEPGDHLLDVACGSGDFLMSQTSHVGQVVGLDISEIEVRLARRRLRHRIAAGTAEVVLGDAVDLPFEDGRFTAVSCTGSFVALTDPDRALAEMRRVLRPGGRAVVSFEMHGDDGKDHSRQEAAWGFPFRTGAEVREMFEAAGFIEVDIIHDGDLMLARGVVPDEVEPDARGNRRTETSSRPGT